MSLPVAFLRAARREYDDAADWYEQRRTGLGAKFTAAAQRVLDRISAQPLSYGVAVDDIREAAVSSVSVLRLLPGGAGPDSCDCCLPHLP